MLCPQILQGSEKQSLEIVSFLKSLRDTIVKEFESLETLERFKKTDWDHPTGGGGQMSVIRGEVFEKAAVNWSGVWGDNFPMQDGSGPFFATGISLITHMANPHAPTVHMNLRYIQTKDRFWFGGGYDLTPMGLTYDEDTSHFHKIAKQALDPFGKELYPIFCKNAKEYFYIPHRKKERGVGGIFFDHYNTQNFEHDFTMWKYVGQTFLDAIIPILKRRIAMPYTVEDKLLQQKLRGHYVEFNLVYDRGTRFGFLSGGNPEAILCSMPPSARW
jgi:coproporphyrinogen III oxidase